MSYTGTVQNDTFKLPAEVHLPDGTPVRIEPLEAPAPARVDAWLERARGTARAGIRTDEVMALTRGEQ